jgi:hypothetical protein
MFLVFIFAINFRNLFSFFCDNGSVDGGSKSLIPWSRVLLEKLTGSQLVKKFPAFYGTRRFITAFTKARHLSLF